MGCAVVIIKTLRPDLFSSGENELTFSGFKHEAETIKQPRRLRTADKQFYSSQDHHQ
jgi:hypothetical protein